MKKQALLLMAGGVLAFASCNTATNEGASQAQIDSMVNARVDEIRLEMMAQNDSLINEMAQFKADSMIAAMKGGSAKSGTKKPAPKKPSEITPVKPAPGSGTTSGSSTPTNTGKNTGQQGTNTGKNTGEQGTNTGKKK